MKTITVALTTEQAKHILLASHEYHLALLRHANKLVAGVAQDKVRSDAFHLWEGIEALNFVYEQQRTGETA